jgi:hypothetical protein
MSGFPDPFEDLAGELRRGPGREWEEEQAAAEEESLLVRLRRRSLADVARQAMHRGSRVRLLFEGISVEGAVVQVGKDYLSVDAGDRTVDVRLGRVVMRLLPAVGPGGSPGGVSATFRARLAEYEQTGEEVTLVGPPTRLQGRVSLLGTDHLVLADRNGELVVPLELVAAVIRHRFNGR